MYGYVYLTTNLVNGKLYVGQRKGSFDPSYLGSGVLLRRAVAKHGREAFKVEVLAETDSMEELNSLEVDFIDFFCAVKDPCFYNLTSSSIGHSCEDRIEKLRRYARSRPESHNRAISVARMGKHGRPGEAHPMYGKSHSEEAKKRIGDWSRGKKAETDTCSVCGKEAAKFHITRFHGSNCRATRSSSLR